VASCGLGLWINDSKFSYDSNESYERKIISMPAFEDFKKHPAGEALLLRLVNMYPNYRVYRCCYGHTQVAEGGLDAGLEIGVKAWDLAATELLMRESGKAYYSFICPGFYDRYIAVYGETELVESIRTVFDNLSVSR